MNFYFFYLFILAELGDHCPPVHTAAVVSEFRFVPVQTEIMEARSIFSFLYLSFFENFLTSPLLFYYSLLQSISSSRGITMFRTGIFPTIYVKNPS